MSVLKLRFCPSPTGLIHLGNARTALFNALYAKGHEGILLLRIEDTDEARSKEEFTNSLKEDLQWLGIFWQEGPEVRGEQGPYWQSQRQDIYDAYYDQLKATHQVYPCFCSEETLAITRKAQMASGQPPRYPGTCTALSEKEINEKISRGFKPVLRFRIPKDEVVEFQDLVKGPQQFRTKDMGDFIIRRQDGTAPFMYCNAVDDALMEVTHVLRGEDHLTNTPRQILILKALGFPIPLYGHISLILGSDNSPLSKRNGSRSVSQLRQEGFRPEALQNYMARLGHYYKNTDFLTFEALAEAFDFQYLSSSPAKYNEEQLIYWQKEAVAHLTEEAFSQWIKPFIEGKVPSQKEALFLQALRGNVVFPTDAVRWAELLFSKERVFQETHQVILKAAGKEFFQFALHHWETSEGNFKHLTTGLQTSLNLKGKALFQPLRLAMTGALDGPEFEVLVGLLGRELITERFLQLKNYCENEGFHQPVSP